MCSGMRKIKKPVKVDYSKATKATATQLSTSPVAYGRTEAILNGQSEIEAPYRGQSEIEAGISSPCNEEPSRSRAATSMLRVVYAVLCIVSAVQIAITASDSTGMDEYLYDTSQVLVAGGLTLCASSFGVVSTTKFLKEIRMKISNGNGQNYLESLLYVSLVLFCFHIIVFIEIGVRDGKTSAWVSLPSFLFLIVVMLLTVKAVSFAEVVNGVMDYATVLSVFVGLILVVVLNERFVHKLVKLLIEDDPQGRLRRIFPATHQSIAR